MMTKEEIEKLGYKSFDVHCVTDDEIIFAFNTGDNVDMYYNQRLDFVHLVTGNSGFRNGNKTLFQGKIENIDDLQFILKSVKAYIGKR